MIEKLRTNYGTMFVPSTDSGQYWWLANTGASPEDEFITAICEMLKQRPTGTAVDVGANFGCWTLPMAACAHSVLAIEPQKCCADLLLQSLEANAIKNVRVLNIAAGARPGRVKIPALDLDESSNFGGVSVAIPHHEQPDAPMTEVSVTRIDHLVTHEAVAFIKVDVEGFESNVLTGARETIMRCRPILFVENDHELTDKDALRNQIERMNYATDVRAGNYLGLPL
jgi:FkbM family methyltransferase